MTALPSLFLEKHEEDGIVTFKQLYIEPSWQTLLPIIKEIEEELVAEEKEESEK